MARAATQCAQRISCVLCTLCSGAAAPPRGRQNGKNKTKQINTSAPVHGAGWPACSGGALRLVATRVLLLRGAQQAGFDNMQAVLDAGQQIDVFCALDNGTCVN